MPSGNVPSAIGRYEVLDSLGHGGMGVVYRGRDPLMGGRLVAIKLLNVADSALRARFLQEAQLASSLREHRNIVTLYDRGEHNGQPYIVMQFIEGITLADQIRHEPPLPLVRKIELVEELATGLDYAHGKGIIHRDVKPANLMIDQDGVLKILDFGIARVGESGLTLVGSMMGTPNYMSPEQVEGGSIDRRSDIFSVGSVAYELFSNRQAFPGETIHRVMLAVAAAAPIPLGTACPGIDPDLARIVERAMERDPDRRYATLATMAADLAGVRRRIGRATVPLPEQMTAVISALAPTLPSTPAPTPHAGGAPDPALAETIDVVARTPPAVVSLPPAVEQQAPPPPSPVDLDARAVEGRPDRFRWWLAAAGAAVVGVSAAALLWVGSGASPEPPGTAASAATTSVPTSSAPVVAPPPPIAGATLPGPAPAGPKRPPLVVTRTPTPAPVEPPPLTPLSSTVTTIPLPAGPVTLAVPSAPPSIPSSVATTSVMPVVTPAMAEQLLARYSAAYRRFDVAALREVFPSLPDLMRRALEVERRDFSSCDYTFAGIVISSASGTSARVEAAGLKSCKPRIGRTVPDIRTHEIFDIVKVADGGWVIARQSTSF
jgi:serine/threonine-protein kinase